MLGWLMCARGSDLGIAEWAPVQSMDTTGSLAEWMM